MLTKSSYELLSNFSSKINPSEFNNNSLLLSLYKHLELKSSSYHLSKVRNKIVYKEYPSNDYIPNWIYEEIDNSDVYIQNAKISSIIQRVTYYSITWNNEKKIVFI